MRLAISILAALALSEPATAERLDSRLGPASPSCVLMVTVGTAASVTPLSADQFAFARGAYVATPPVSPTLPPGERAALIEADGAAMVALTTGEGKAAETCARFVNSSNWDRSGYAFLEDCEHDAPIRMALYPRPPGAFCLSRNRQSSNENLHSRNGRGLAIAQK